MVSTEAELVAAARKEGKATVAAGVTIKLTKTLLLQENLDDGDEEKYLCE